MQRDSPAASRPLQAPPPPASRPLLDAVLKQIDEINANDPKKVCSVALYLCS